jgi:hypothetical protein
VRGGPKTLAALVTLLLMVGLAACGGDDGSSSTTASGQAQSKSSNSGSGGGGKAGGEGQLGNSGSGESNFVPKQHEDSGGGSQQFRVKGGDNSIQEFGAEADTSEFEEAAAVVHNFLDARAAGDWAAVCTYMSSSIIESFEELAEGAQQIEDRSCAGLVEALMNPAAKRLMQVEAAKADVRSLRTEGDRGFVIYTGVEGSVYAVPMAREDGTWKVGSLTATQINY